MKTNEKKLICETEEFARTQMQKQRIIQNLKDRGGRMTRQRQLLLDIILEEECSCCKEIYYKAAGRDKGISLATVYRMVNMLEDIGAISRQNMYKVVCGGDCGQTEVYSVEFDDGTAVQLPAESWYQVVRTGLKECGYLKNRELRCVSVSTDGPSGFRVRESEIG